MYKYIKRALRLGNVREYVPGSFLYTNTIYIHIPKCAGQSIAASLYGHTVHHYKASFYYKYFPKFFDSAFVFSCVREPISRFLSAYSYLKSGGRTQRDARIRDSYIKNNDINSFVNYIYSSDFENNIDLMHFHTQTSFLTLADDPYLVIANRVYNFNNLNSFILLVS